MPTIAQTGVALAIALGLAGGGAAIAQPSKAIQGHTSFVAMIEFFGEPEEERVISGTVGCEARLLTRLLRQLADRDVCEYEGYAYAYPADATAPWESHVQWVNDSYYVDRTGSIWHVAEIVYREARGAPEGGEELVRAIASELLPAQTDPGGLGVNYVLPVDLDKLNAGEMLIVGFGPAPSPTLA